MNLRSRARTLAMTAMLAVAISTSVGVAQFASAEPVHQTGPNGGQCNLNGMDTDFSSADNNYKTNDAVDAFGDTGPRMQVAGCELVALPPVEVTSTPTPTPMPKPTRVPVRQSTAPKPAGIAS